MLLSINTCGDTGSAALARLNSTNAAVEFLAQAEFANRTHSAQLVPRIGELLTRQKATVSDLEAIVVVHGPGSFTGIRVGVSTAKGLAEAAGIPVIAVSQLALVARVSGLPHVLAVIDGGRGEYYVGEYREGSMVRELLLSRESVIAAAQLTGAQLVYQNPPGMADVRNAFPGAEVQLITAPDAADALRLSIARFLSRSFDDVETLDANYLRRSDAELFGAPDLGGGKGMGGASTRT